MSWSCLLAPLIFLACKLFVCIYIYFFLLVNFHQFRARLSVFSTLLCWAVDFLSLLGQKNGFPLYSTWKTHQENRILDKSVFKWACNMERVKKSVGPDVSQQVLHFPWRKYTSVQRSQTKNSGIMPKDKSQSFEFLYFFKGVCWCMTAEESHIIFVKPGQRTFTNVGLWGYD